MTKPPQKRTLETRARLLSAAQALTDENGFEALRVEEVVAGAGVAKGTFFAHFRDKDALMDILIGARIAAYLDALDGLPAPQTVGEMVDRFAPLIAFMTCERYVFDVILRYSGAALHSDIGPIAASFGRHLDVVAGWLEDAPFRKDVAAVLLAEGVQAFFIQVMALKFCALHQDVALEDRLVVYLDAWLLPRA